jgi:hypothetical protein
VSFLHQASGLFIASRYIRDNYKRELKRGKWEHPMQSKQEQFPRENLRLDSGQHVSQNSGAGFEGELNNRGWPYSVLQKGRLSGYLFPNISSNNDKLQCIIRIQEIF